MSKKLSKIKMKIELCLYWVSVVLPIYDVIVGTINGIKTIISEAKAEQEQKNVQQKLNEQIERFNNDN